MTTFDGRAADHVMKFPRPSPSIFCILQAIKNWRRRRTGNEATSYAGKMLKVTVSALYYGPVESRSSRP